MKCHDLLTNILVARQLANFRKAGCHASLGDILECASRKEKVDIGRYLDNVLLVSNTIKSARRLS
jgi:hypothetical protein